MVEIFKSEIEWRSDVRDIPRNRRVLMIAIPVTPDQPDAEPEIVVAHWHPGSLSWVAAGSAGDRRRVSRIQLKPIYWADLALPAGLTLRRLDLRDLNE